MWDSTRRQWYKLQALFDDADEEEEEEGPSSGEASES